MEPARALTHRGWVTFALFVLCLTLRQIFGPLEDMRDPWGLFARDLGSAAVFVITVG